MFVKNPDSACFAGLHGGCAILCGWAPGYPRQKEMAIIILHTTVKCAKIKITGRKTAFGIAFIMYISE
jgi:hypothetical protein